jgi:CHASE3 domain sensor protein
MTQNEIIEMAKEARLFYGDKLTEDYAYKVKRFAKLVEDKVRQEIIEKNAPVIKKVNEHIKELQDAVKAEREACANVCEQNFSIHGWAQGSIAAQAIRARGET